MWLGALYDVTYRKRELRFEKKSVSWVPASERMSWVFSVRRRRLTFAARRGLAAGATLGGGGGGGGKGWQVEKSSWKGRASLFPMSKNL